VEGERRGEAVARVSPKGRACGFYHPDKNQDAGLYGNIEADFAFSLFLGLLVRPHSWRAAA
jgi:hypothetical protein